jgi:hypothetical protein
VRLNGCRILPDCNRSFAAERQAFGDRDTFQAAMKAELNTVQTRQVTLLWYNCRAIYRRGARVDDWGGFEIRMPASLQMVYIAQWKLGDFNFSLTWLEQLSTCSYSW